MADFQFKGREPFRLWTCPECAAVFKGPSVSNGKRCPNGHWHSFGHLRYFEDHGHLPPPRGRVKTVKVKPQTAMQPDEALIALDCWRIAYANLLPQLPAGPLRGLVEGAFSTIHRATLALVNT